MNFYIFGYSRYSRDNWDFQVEEEDCESTRTNTYLTKLINRQGDWIEIYYESFHELAPVASGAEGEDTGDPCLRSRSCIYTGWVIHGLHGTVTPVRSINILRAVIPQHPQPSPPFMPRIRTYTVGSACIPSHVRRCIIFPRHAVVSAHAKAAEPGTGNVGHVYTTSPLPPVCPAARATACISQKSWHGTTSTTTTTATTTTPSQPRVSFSRVITNSPDRLRIKDASARLAIPPVKIRASIVYGWDRSISRSLEYYSTDICSRGKRVVVVMRVHVSSIATFYVFIDSLRLFAWKIYINIAY